MVAVLEYEAAYALRVGELELATGLKNGNRRRRDFGRRPKQETVAIDGLTWTLVPLGPQLDLQFFWTAQRVYPMGTRKDLPAMCRTMNDEALGRAAAKAQLFIGEAQDVGHVGRKRVCQPMGKFKLGRLERSRSVWNTGQHPIHVSRNVERARLATGCHDNDVREQGSAVSHWRTSRHEPRRDR